MRRFFIDPANITKDCGLITEQEARHIALALRLKPGQAIELFDGQGMVYQAEITAVRKSTVDTRILSCRRHHEGPPFLSLAQALVKGSKFDLIVQKATELGISAIQPLVCQHCDVKSASASQLSRWQRIVHEACKQCGRPTPLLCQPAVTLPHLLSHSQEVTAKIIFWENESTTTLHDLDLRAAERVLLLIGPEGGFTRQEADSALEHGFLPVSLGPRILRAETAAMTAMAIVQFLLGNLNRNQDVS